MKDILFVSCGAILGANFRFAIYQKFKNLSIKKDFSILLINTFASFSLGLFMSILTRIDSSNFSYHLALFVSIGFLGSLSTFSTFVSDLFDAILQYKFFSYLNLFLVSLISGVIAVSFGIFLGTQ